MDDLISRQKAIDAINNVIGNKTIFNKFITKIIINAIKSLPSVEPKPKNGRWIGKTTRSVFGSDAPRWNDRVGYICSECQHEVGEGENTKYCPNCGSKMITQSIICYECD